MNFETRQFLSFSKRHYRYPHFFTHCVKITPLRIFSEPHVPVLSPNTRKNGPEKLPKKNLAGNYARFNYFVENRRDTYSKCRICSRYM